MRNVLVNMLLLSALACWLSGLINMIRTIDLRKAGLPFTPSRWESAGNWLFRPTDLTPEGLVARRRCFLSFLGFLLCCGLAPLVGTLMK